MANIVPIPKPNKDTDKGTSYRPISLLSVISKTLEKSLLPYITANIPNTPMQHGYKTQHSTVTALHTLNNTVSKWFNQMAPPARTITVALDMSKAYTTYRNHTSKQRQFKNGVPQGGVLSPTLCNIYTSDLPPPSAPVQVMAYADVITITSTHTSTSAAKKYIQPYLLNIISLLGSNKNTVLPEYTCSFTLASTINMFYRLLVYSAGSGVNRVQVVLSGFSKRLFCFALAKTVCRYGCMYFLAALVLVCAWMWL